MALIVGTVTNVCCECTARDAAMRNFKTIMISDANASRNDAEHNATLSIFLQAFGGVISTDEAIAAHQRGKLIVSGSARGAASVGLRFTTRPEIIGTFGAVSSTHWLASAVGMSILERGGNAFDAAVATGFTLQIVEPHLSGPAGDMPAILYSARDRAVRVLCAQGTAPAAATIAKFRELGLAMIPGTGFLAAAVPGAFDGWMLLLRDYGNDDSRGGAWRRRSAMPRTASRSCRA